ncbi:MAG TPA: hypothetical protein VLT62_21965 [Candidatus Methylomirabilis sp.]|nr:hypothetical protein [Candidatus Methylomirabilis sp.]
MRNSVIIMGLMLCLGQPVWAVAAENLQEVRIRWDVHPGSPTPHVAPESAVPSTRFTLLERHRVSGTLPRQRSPELSSEQIVVVAMDGQGNERYRGMIRDPRILRVEHPGPAREMKGRALHRARTELRITLPDDPAISEVWLYHPRWTGSAFILDWLGTVQLP